MPPSPSFTISETKCRSYTQTKVKILADLGISNNTTKFARKHTHTHTVLHTLQKAKYFFHY